MIREYSIYVHIKYIVKEMDNSIYSLTLNILGHICEYLSLKNTQMFRGSCKLTLSIPLTDIQQKALTLWQTRKSGSVSIEKIPFTDPDLLKIMEVDYGFLRIANDISLMYQEVDRKDGHNTNCGSVRFLRSLSPKEAVALYFKGLQEPKRSFFIS